MRIIGNDPSTPRQAQVVASGTLSTGDAVVVNSDGTVSVVGETAVSSSAGSSVVFENSVTNKPSAVFDSNSNKVVISYPDNSNSNYGSAIVGTVSGTSITFGTPVVFESAESNSFASTFDGSSNKIVIAYADGGNSYYGTAVVGTVSGTSISFGSPVVFANNGTANQISATFDSDSNKVVVAYRDDGNSEYGTAAVGTVSGTAISFGTPVVFEAASTTDISATFDSINNKIVIAYSDGGNSGYGTAIVGTVSGTSISFGSAALFESDYVISISAAFDTASSKVVIAYTDWNNSLYGTAVIGTVSGASISFNTPVVFESASSVDISISFATFANKVVIAYRDIANSNRGTAIVGTVSGASISFESPVIFAYSNAQYMSTAVDGSSNKVVIAYTDSGNSNYGTSVVFQPAYTSLNLTANNYIGTAATGAPDGTGAKINLKGAVDENQSGLTAGQSYYVQTDGTLGTTPADPSVFAGTAVAATKLIVKG